MGGRGSSYSRSGALGPRGKAATIDEALAVSNPHYREGKEWQQNCQRCVYAYEMQRRGYDVEAKPRIFDGSDRLPYMYDQNGWLAVMENAQPVDLPSRSTIRVMAEKMAEWGDGSRAIVKVSWKGRHCGHVFIAEQVKGGTTFVDPQTGHYVDIHSYMDQAIKGQTKLVRIDNLKTTSLIEKCVNRRT